MRQQQNDVRTFHQKHEYTSATVPRLVPYPLAVQRHKFIDEEAKEYLTAAAERNLTAIADALGDLLYVVLGTCVVHGIDIEPIFAEVHRSNMTKTPLDPITKKGGKGPGYERPNLAPILIEQMTRLASKADPVTVAGCEGCAQDEQHGVRTHTHIDPLEVRDFGGAVRG